MNNGVSVESKNSVIKSLAIIGFIVLIIFGVWVAVRIVQYLPSAFSNLASLADNIYQSERGTTLTLTTEESVVNVGEAYTITWEGIARPGTYSFSYICTERTTIDVRVANGQIVALPCNEPLVIPNTVNELEIMVKSEGSRFTDVPYTLTFTEENQTEALASATGTVTVVNARIPQNTGVAQNNTPANNTPRVVPPSHEHTPTSNQHTVTTTPQTKKVTYTYFPVSNPKGFADLQITYVGAGKMKGHTFVPTTQIEDGEEGAIQIQVKNIGTKTSDEWQYEVELPTGYDFESEDQDALLPNEHALLTIGFTMNDLDSESVHASVTGGEDKNKSNNSFTKRVFEDRD